MQQTTMSFQLFWSMGVFRVVLWVQTPLWNNCITVIKNKIRKHYDVWWKPNPIGNI